MACMLTVVRPCVLSKGYAGMQRLSAFYLCVVQGRYGMPCSILSIRVCGKKVIMSCHDRRRLTVCAVKVQRRHATPNTVRSYVLSMCYDGSPLPMFFDRLCCLRAMMACYA